MRYIEIPLLLLVAILSSCGGGYAKLSREEERLIRDYISREHIHVVDTLPSYEDFAANPKLYYHDYFTVGYNNYDIYYRTDVQGTGAELKPYDKVQMRYKQYELRSDADTISCWTTLDRPDPIEFAYLSDYNTGCYGWHLAVRLMEYSGSECTCIIPSRSGNTAAQNSVTPYGYKLKMKIKK